MSGGIVSGIGAAPPAYQSDGAINRLQSSVDDILGMLRTQRIQPPAELTDIRDKQRAYFKANQKFPDYIDIGVRVWERMYDWHIATLQPLKISRAADGHLQIEVMLTTLLLRTDVADTFIGVPYDR